MKSRMKKIISLIVALFIIIPITSNAHKNDVAFYTKKIRGKSVNVVVINANSKDLEFGVAKGNDNRVGWEKFESIINRKKPIAAINGNFFNAYAKNPDDLFPYGYIYDKGEKINGGETLNKGSFAVMKDGTYIIDNSGNIDIENVWTMVEAGPLLLKNGEEVFEKYCGNSEAKIKTNAAQRSGIGIREDGKILLVTCSGIKTSEFAKVMKDLGCLDATNLDGGASSALYAKGKYVTNPGRKLNTVLCVYDNSSK